MPKSIKLKPDAAETFRKQVRRLMGKQELTHTVLADRLGVKRSAVSRMLSEPIQPRLDTVQAYAEALGVRVVDLLKGC